MNIGIPLSDNLIATRERLAMSFHHTSLFGIYDTTNNILETIVLNQDDYSGSFTDLLTEWKIEAVICPQYTVMGLKLFKLMKIETFKAEGFDLMANIDALQIGELKPYTFDDAREAAAKMCTSSCNTCSSTC